MNYTSTQLLSSFRSGSFFNQTITQTNVFVLNYSTKLIIKAEGETIGILRNESLPVIDWTNGLSVYNIVTETIYSKISNRIFRFYSRKRINKTKSYCVSFVLGNCNNHYINGLLSINLLVHAENKNALIYATKINDDLKWNQDLLVISDIDTFHYSKIMFAASLLHNSSVVLKNQQYNILQLMVKGHTSLDIAAILCISEHTVDDNRKELIKVFSASNYHQMIYHAYQQGFI